VVAGTEETTMDASDKPVLPVALRLREAFNVIQGMLAENGARRDAVRSLPADRQEQESQRLASDREQIVVLAKILQGLVATTMEAIRDNDYPAAVALGLREALNVAKRMLAECVKGLEMVGGLPPERRHEETQRLDRDLEFTRVLVKIVGGVADGVIEGRGRDAEEPPAVPR
jgi:hypothetical protein